MENLWLLLILRHYLSGGRCLKGKEICIPQRPF